jgi:hypothetical protein
MNDRFNKYKLLVLLLLADIVFIILHIFYIYTPLLPSRYFSLTFAGGYSEFFQYTKYFWIMVLFFVVSVRWRRLMYAIFSFLFLYFLIDDSFELHEGYGAFIADFFHFTPAFGLRAVDLGELAVSGLFGVLFLVAIGITYALSTHTDRRVAIEIIIMVVLLAVFGVGFDMVEITVRDAGISRVLRIFEEGGELIVTSFILFFAYSLDLNHQPLFSYWRERKVYTQLQKD